MRLEFDMIEITITRVPDGERGDLLGFVRLVPASGGYAIYARDAEPHGEHDFWQVRGWLAAGPQQGFWRLAQRAIAWASAEAEKR